MEISGFSPAKKELKELASKYEDIVIKNVNDEEGYNIAKKAKNELVKMRTSIEKFGKSKRIGYMEQHAEVLRQEREHIEIIAPVEANVKRQIAMYTEKKKIKEREVLIPMRQEMLAKIDLKLSKKELLDMDEKAFTAFYMESKEEYDREQTRIRDEKDAKVAREQEIKDAEAKATKDAMELAERKAQDLADAQEKEKQDEKEAQEKKKQDEKEEQDKINKNKMYATWKNRNEYDASMHIIQREGDTFSMYVKISEITIK